MREDVEILTARNFTAARERTAAMRDRRAVDEMIRRGEQREKAHRLAQARIWWAVFGMLVLAVGILAIGTQWTEAVLLAVLACFAAKEGAGLDE